MSPSGRPSCVLIGCEHVWPCDDVTVVGAPVSTWVPRAEGRGWTGLKGVAGANRGAWLVWLMGVVEGVAGLDLLL